MGIIKKLLVFFILGSSLTACSSTLWVVESQDEIDRNNFNLLNSTLFIEKSSDVTPENPLLRFKLKSANTYEYDKRIKTDRYIQSYRPRLSSTLIGLVGAGIASYVAFSDTFIEDPTTIQRNVLLGSAALVSSLSFLNMKAVGEPTPTDESRLLRKTGSVIEIDTLAAKPGITELPQYSIYFNGQEIVPLTEREFVNDELVFSLVEELNPEEFPEEEFAEIDFRVSFNDSLYRYNIPISSVFESFVVVSSNITALRNKPEINSSNVLTDLAFGSQLQMVKREGDWYKVLYGISENWVLAEDVYTIWRPSKFAEELSVITVPNMPFGQIDIEQEIPLKPSDVEDKWAFIITNEVYPSNYTGKNYAERDGLLMEAYANNALGLVDDKILRFTNVSGNQLFRNAFSRLISGINNTPNKLMIYLSGNAEVDHETNTVYFLGTGSSNSSSTRIDLNSFFDGLTTLPLKSIQIIADLRFVEPKKNDQVLQNLSSIITTKFEKSIVVFSSETGQRSYEYSIPNGVNKRHSIFSYFLADALKQNLTSWNDIVNHLERNVSFTSRSNFNRPQDIQFFGEKTLLITD